MKNKYELPELLAPAGDFEALRAAVAAGADAVYIGGKRFGARAYAKNFEIDEIKRAVIFFSCNTLILFIKFITTI
jgi:putative protease